MNALRVEFFKNFDYKLNIELKSTPKINELFGNSEIAKLLSSKLFMDPDGIAARSIINGDINVESLKVKFDDLAPAKIIRPCVSTFLNRNPLIDETRILFNDILNDNFNLSVFKRISLIGTCRIRSAEAKIGPDNEGNTILFAQSEDIINYLITFIHFFNTAQKSEQNSDTFVLNSLYAMAMFLTIHPFVDGNGRISRVLLQAILMKKFGVILPVLPIGVVVCINSEKYISALRELTLNDCAINYIKIMDEIICISLDLLLKSHPLIKQRVSHAFS